MKCPMLMYNYLPEEKPTKGAHSECIKLECAWWDEEIEDCDPTGLRPVLIAIGNVLGRIHDDLCLSRYTYTCHYCGVRIEIKPDMGHYEPVKWSRIEQVDGRDAWICDRCIVMKG